MNKNRPSVEVQVPTLTELQFKTMTETKAIRVSENWLDTDVEQLVEKWSSQLTADLVVVRGEHEVVYDETEQ